MTNKAIMSKLLSGFLGFCLFSISAVASADVEIWMISRPDCPYCDTFLHDYGLDGVRSGDFKLSIRNPDPFATDPDHVVLRIVNQYDLKSVPVDIAEAVRAHKVNINVPTPWFIRWDPRFQRNTGEWRHGWQTQFNPVFLIWVRDGGNV